MENQLLDLDVLTEHSWKQYKPNMGYYALLILVSGLISFVAYIVIIAAVLLLGSEYLAPLAGLFDGVAFSEIPKTAYIAAAVTLIPIIAGALVIACWQNAVVWSGILHESERSIGKSLTRGFAATPRFIGMEFFSSIAIFIGALLFIVPGIILAGLFMFADITATKGAGPFESLRQSVHLIRGRWWAIVGRFVVVAFAVMIIPNIIAMMPEIFGFSFDSPEIIVRLIMLGYTIVISVCTTFFLQPWLKVFKKVLYDDAHRTTPRFE